MFTDSPTPVTGVAAPHLTLWRAMRMASASFHFAAAGALAAILAAFLLHWPIPSTGLSIDVATGIVLGVEPGSMAEQGGITVGDQIVRIYDYRWADIGDQLWLFPLDWQISHPVPIDLIHADTPRHTTLIAQAPSWHDLAERATWCILALVFWSTGYVFGVLRVPGGVQVPTIAWYWVSLGVITGVQNIVRYGSYPLSVALWYVLVTIYAPAAVLINVWFVDRAHSLSMTEHVTYWTGRVIIGLQCLALFTGLIWQPTVVALRDWLSALILPAASVALIASSALLWQGYRQTPVLHVKRQIRLLAAATLLVAGVWVVTRIIPFMLALDPPLAGHWVVLLSCIIPGAYLAGSYIPDLYRLDRIATWLLRQLAVIAVVCAALIAIASILDVQGPAGALWMVIAFIAAYRPVAYLIGALLWLIGRQHVEYGELVETARTMTTTLDRDQLTQMLMRGLHQTFKAPPLAVYLHDLDDPTRLVLAARERLQPPPTLSYAACTALLSPGQSLLTHAALRIAGDTDSEETGLLTLLTMPGIALWAPLWQTRDQLQGIVLIGHRVDLDPYRQADLHELMRLFDAASLAYANSTALLDRQRDAITIRELYRRLQHSQDETVAGIAREIHDEVINVGVRTSLNSMRRLLERSVDPSNRDELEDMIAGTQAMAMTLRNLCERIYPHGSDDPLGLASVLRRQIDRLQASWGGICSLLVTGKPLPIEPAIQREALRIMREAVTNAIKHAGGSQIDVFLAYPMADGQPVRLEICDNGPLRASIRPRPGHLGLHNMMESARAIGGQLTICTRDTGGTSVTLLIDLKPTSLAV